MVKYSLHLGTWSGGNYGLLQAQLAREWGRHFAKTNIFTSGKWQDEHDLDEKQVSKTEVMLISELEKSWFNTISASPLKVYIYFSTHDKVLGR